MSVTSVLYALYDAVLQLSDMNFSFYFVPDFVPNIKYAQFFATFTTFYYFNAYTYTPFILHY